MSLCPACGRALCDHTPEQRGQTFREMTRPLSPEELKVWEDHPDGTGYIPEKMQVAQRHAHDPA